jgi:pyruvate oxidase
MKKLKWSKVLEDTSQLPEGRVMTVTADNHDYCLAHHDGKFCILDNKCPHQGGPLGEGSIENGLLRCPWHGWDYDPCSGKVPGFDDGVETYEAKVEDNSVFIGLAEKEAAPRTVADVMVETMVNWGVDTVFGMVGHSNLGLADAFRKMEKAGKLKYFGIRHEGAASFAASAYGKLTKRPAACFAIAGPGSTNMYTGMWDAKVDRAPLLALTGQVATQVVGTGNFQELDLVRAFQTVADFNHRVQTDSRHQELMGLAIKHAIINRDVSHLTFPDEVQQAIPKSEEAKGPQNRMPKLVIQPDAETLNTSIAMLREAKRPVIVVGHGARGHMDLVTRLAEKLNSPILTTFKGKGLISDSHPLGCGVLGRSGTPIASWFMNESDLLLVIGASFSNHTGITPKKRTIQIDMDPMALAKFHQVDACVWGEIGVTVDLIAQDLGSVDTTDQRPEVATRWKIWKDEKKNRLKDDHGKGVSSIAVFDALTKAAPENAIMCVDVGNNAYSFGRYFESKQHTFLMSGYLGSIGFALPAAIGAWAAMGAKRPVIAVAGDGGFGQYMADFTTAVKYNMNIKMIILNNNELGKISKEQKGDDLNVFATDLVNPDFSSYARSCGAFGVKITSKDDLDSSLVSLFEHPGPGLLEIQTDVQLI